MAFWLLPFFALACIPPWQSAHAQNGTPLAEFRNRVQLAYDFELSTQQLANIVPHIDRQHLEESLRAGGLWDGAINGEVLDEYIMAPGAVDALPPGELRDQLFKGLNLETNLVEKKEIPLALRRPEKPAGPKTDAQNPQGPGILVREQKIQERSLILPDSATKSPTNRSGILDPRNFQQSESGLALPKATDWQTLYARWRALPPDQKRKVLRFELVPNRTVAEIIERELPIPNKNKFELDQYVKLKDSAPDWLKKSDLSLDGRQVREGKPKPIRSLEIALKGTIKDPDEFFKHLDELGRSTGLKVALESPALMKRGNAATHIHFSVESVDVKKVDRIMLEWKKLHLVRLLDAGSQYDSVLAVPVGTEGMMLQNIYDREISDKHSTIRRVEHGHYEIKEHYGSVRDELNELIPLLHKDEPAAMKQIEDEIKRIAKNNPQIIERIKRINPSVLYDFKGLVSESEIAKIIGDHSRATVKKGSAEELSVAVRAIARRAPQNAKTLRELEQLTMDISPDGIADLPNALRNWNIEPHSETAKALIGLYNQHRKLQNSFSLFRLEDHKLLSAHSEDLLKPALAQLKISEGIGETLASVRYLSRLIDRIDTKVLPEALKQELADQLERKSKANPALSVETRVSTYSAISKLLPDRPVPKTALPYLRTAVISPFDDTRTLALEIAEKHFRNELLFAGPAAEAEDSTWAKHYRSEFFAAATDVSQKDSAGFINYILKYKNHGTDSLIAFVDPYSIRGMTQEMEKLLEQESMVEKLMTSDGARTLFSPRRIEDFERLATAIAKTTNPKAKTLFLKIGTRHLLEGSAGDPIQQQIAERINRAAQPFTESKLAEVRLAARDLKERIRDLGFNSPPGAPISSYCQRVFRTLVKKNP